MKVVALIFKLLNSLIDTSYLILDIFRLVIGLN